jgi:tetratricopeptide (TPR) repeat protein
VVQITRICSLIALSGAVLIANPVAAKRSSAPPSTALKDYMLARVADQKGDPADALARYSRALDKDSGNKAIAMQAFRAAVREGDFKFATRAAQLLAAEANLPFDVQTMLLTDRVKAGDWKGAKARITQIETADNLRFMGPILRAWIAQSTKDVDPLSFLSGLPAQSSSSLYAPEHRAYLLMARGSEADSVTLTRSLVLANDGLPALRLSVATSLIRAGKAEAGLGMLGVEQAALSGARAIAQTNAKALPPPVRTTAQGIAQFYSRLSSDLSENNSADYALVMARFARYLDPVNPFVALSEARALAGSKLTVAAEKAYEKLSLDPIIAAKAQDARVGLLADLDRNDDAIALARRLAFEKGAGIFRMINLGDLLGRAEKYEEAGRAYDAALQANLAGDNSVETWALWYLKATAFERGKNWPEARAAFERSVALAPNQPGPLNHFGYALLERRVDIPAALALTRRAYQLKPGDASIADSYGWALYLSGDLENAVDTLETAVVGEPTEPTLGDHLGDVYWLRVDVLRRATLGRQR